LESQIIKKSSTSKPLHDQTNVPLGVRMTCSIQSDLNSKMVAQTFDWLKHFFNSLSELLHANSSDLPEIFLLFHFGVNLKFKMTDLASDWLRH
jgi:hypothetical protein